MLATEDVPAVYAAYRARYTARDERMAKMDQAVRGIYSSVDPDGDSIVSRSPNLIQVALEDTSEAASMVPTIRVTPWKATKGPKESAVKMEKIGASYFDVSKMDLLLTSTVADVLAFGFAVWVAWPDEDQNMPIIEKRDPRTCYPEPGYRPGDSVRKCMFTRSVRYSQLPKAFQVQLVDYATSRRDEIRADANVILLEWFDEDEFATFALYESRAGLGAYGTPTYLPVQLGERTENVLKVCPVVLPTRTSLDGEMRGQYDQVIGIMEGHVRLMGLVMDYADQAVYSDIWVKDLIGDMAFGGGGYIELGPNGAIGRVPPAVSSLDVQRDLEHLQDAFHLGARWPKARPGQVDQSIASAKFVEAVAGTMNTTIRNIHGILRRALEQVLRVCFATDIKFFPTRPGEPKTAAGVMKNQEFIEEYETSDIDMKNRVRIEYGVGLGRDPSQTAVLNIQYGQAGYVSKEFAQENIDGLYDVERERRRIDVQQFRDMALAMLLQGLQEKTIPPEALIKIAQARENGTDDVFALYKKFIIDPQAAAAAGAVQSGLGAGLMPPGPPGQPPLPGAGPPGEAAGPQPPIPPQANQMMSRLTSALPGGSGFISSNNQSA